VHSFIASNVIHITALFSVDSTRVKGYSVALLVQALRYKPEGSGFDALLCHWNFH
jgi:hypothetical protein